MTNCDISAKILCSWKMEEKKCSENESKYIKSFVVPFNGESHYGENRGIRHCLGCEHFCMAHELSQSPRILFPQPEQLERHS